MVPCRGTSIVTFFLAIIATAKATSETKDCHSCCENQAVKEGSKVTLTFYSDFDLTESKNSILEVRHQTEHQLSPPSELFNHRPLSGLIHISQNHYIMEELLTQFALRQQSVLASSVYFKLGHFKNKIIKSAQEPVFHWTNSNNQVRGGYQFNNLQNHTLIISIPYVNSSYAGNYSLSHSCVKIPIVCQLDVRTDVQSNKILSKQCQIPESESRIPLNNTCHSCCENQEVKEGSAATLTFYTDFDLTASKNSILEVRHQAEHQLSPQPVFQRTTSNTQVRNGNKFDNVQNRILVISIPYVNSSYAGNYSLSHSCVKIPIACQLDVRKDVQSNRILSKQCQIPESVSANAPETNPLGGREDTGEYNLSKIIAPSVTIIVVIGVILAILYIARENRYLCFRHRQNDTHENGHESEKLK